MGVYDIVDMTCTKCKKTTKHETEWESEWPDMLVTKCQECGLDRTTK